MGFGHRVYKSYDPRAKVIKKIADLVFTVTGKNPLLEIALELERIALQDDYFVTRKLYPNVDFYSGLIYQAMGFPVEMFPVLFAIPRTAGWIAQWEEMLLDPEQKIARPRQIYTGAEPRDYVPREKRRRRESGDPMMTCLMTSRWRCCCQTPGAGSASFDSNRAWEHLRQLVAIGPRPAGSAAIEQTRKYIKDQLAAVGVAVAEQAWDDADADRAGPHGQPDRHDSRRAQGPHRHRRPLRHQAVPRVPVRRRQRRRVERGVPDRARARAEGAPEPADDRAAVSRRRRSGRSNGPGTDNTYGSRHYVETAKSDGSLASLKALILVDMIGDRDLRIRRDTNSTPWLTDIIWDAAQQQKLDRRTSCPSARRSKTTTCRSWRPACRRSTSSISNTRHGTPPSDTLDAVSARSLQVVGDALSPRCRRSKRASPDLEGVARAFTPRRGPTSAALRLGTPARLASYL